MLTLERILKTKEGKSKAARHGAAAAIILAGFLIFILPGIRKIPQINASIRTKTQIIDLKEKKAANMQALADRCRDYEHEHKRILAYLLTEQEHESFSENLSETARKAGLTVHSIQPKAKRALTTPADSASFLVEESPVQMILSGKYHTVVSFLNQLSQTGKLLNVARFTIESDEQDTVNLNIDLTVSAYSVKGAKGAKT